MFDIEAIKIGAVAAIAALVLTVTSVGAAVGPALAIETAPVQVAAAQGGAAHV